ncbi:hypothetical protein DdX_21322 [Ditylenchus destructor]|uniref:Uncharacterized protein n=1 Tax=Ditylenchus destructor TaxID=166010 RepID=A0AAD4MF22_9BILA|nr:hypothetical protein DdX_21322 [Ditylenchus destructor]
MVEALKYLSYMQLAKSSLVAKRFSNLIRTHRHSLALLDVERIYMDLNLDRGHSLIPNAAIKIFNNELSPEAYTEWVVHNNYSKQIIHGGRVAKMQSRQYGHHFYEMRADYRDSNQSPNGTKTTVFSARKQLNHKYWPLFQHFVRLLSDPFVYIRYLKLIPQIDVYFLNLLSGAINPYHGRLQCGQLDFQGVQLGTFWENVHKGNVQKLLGWIKNHVHCNELRFSHQPGSNYDEALLDFFMTGAHCTSATTFRNCDISNVIVAFLKQQRSICDIVREVWRHFKWASYIATLDNGTMVEALKYLNYMQLAKSSLVAKRFSNLIRTHRHSLALLDVERIYMDLNLKFRLKSKENAQILALEAKSGIQRERRSDGTCNKEKPIGKQKFTDLKSGDESQMVVSIRCYGAGRLVEVLKANFADLIVKEEKCGVRTVLLFELVNNDIGKQLQITTRTISSTMYNETEFLLEIRNL